MSGESPPELMTVMRSFLTGVARPQNAGMGEPRERQSDPGEYGSRPLSFFGVHGQFALKGASDHGFQTGGNGAPEQSAKHGIEEDKDVFAPNLRTLFSSTVYF